MKSVSESRKTLRNAIQETVGKWEWTHLSKKPDSKEDEMCKDDNEECSHCEKVAGYAKSAETAAIEALKAIDSHEYINALDFVTECERIEAGCGDVVIYKGLVDLAIDLIESKIRSAKLACYQWIVPPKNKGQIVEVAYANVLGRTWKREYDSSHCGSRGDLYRYIEVGCPDGDDCNHTFEPYNAAPECDMFEYKEDESR